MLARRWFPAEFAESQRLSTAVFASAAAAVALTAVAGPGVPQEGKRLLIYGRGTRLPGSDTPDARDASGREPGNLRGLSWSAGRS